MTFEFHSPWWFLALLPLGLLAVLAWRRRPPAIGVSCIASFASAARHERGRRLRWRRLPLVLGVLALALFIVALARPRYGIEQALQRGRGIDIMLALDVSGSMSQFYDNVPERMLNRRVTLDEVREKLESRLELAVRELLRFVENRADDRIGLIVFSRIPFLVSPPTLDHDFVLSHLKMLDDMRGFPDGTGIAAPLGSVVSRLKGSPAKRRVAVLFSDGADNASQGITPRQAARVAVKFNITVYTVGIGSEQSYGLQSSFFGYSFQPIQQGYDRELLQDIADATGGRFFGAGDADEFKRVMDEIDELEKTELKKPFYTEYRERFLPFAIAGLVLLLIAVALENSVLQVLP